MAVEKKQVLTVKNIRNVNMGNILQSIIRNKNATRSILAKENHISLMTVKHVVDDLIAAGILVEKESCNTDVGRNPKVLEIAENYGNIVCVNLTSEDEISFLIYDIYESLLEEQSVSLEGAKSYRESLTAVIEAVKERLKAIDTVTVGIAVFVPSAYDEAVDLVNYDLIPGFKELHIRALFEEEFGISNILVLHDVFAAARSEYDSLNPEMESQFYFYCGYGVGGFFIHKNVAVAGTENMAGEVGKMLISMDGNEQGCITLEEVVSISAVSRRMKEQGMKLHFSEMLELYQAGDSQAVQLLTPVLNTVSRVLYNLLWVYNPTRLVVDSCKSNYCKIITEHFRKFMENMKNDAIPIYVQVRPAKYDEYHMMRGCFYMTRNAWIDRIADSI
ncbi:ROK family protein [Faecalicatena contorta]|uniref:Sugar kinase of the NBD/HSP70 family, may contain an N-terminal HTH domain n=1 Tax=Faecalicatena contorta TaxID=39482 RepID=A0A316AAT6_9FIRM|nr:ROK family protein [Faecalicatena contorta]PWJ46927.1 putative NBD/HSP70 family sugar kinase [Faecalicatena contorta]SUQ16255.1 Sugar kinase of the NBD/HSP70 family, may contain an N-terminal HTH domain [Faecalicatena contorta]